MKVENEELHFYKFPFKLEPYKSPNLLFIVSGLFIPYIQMKQLGLILFQASDFLKGKISSPGTIEGIVKMKSG